MLRFYTIILLLPAFVLATLVFVFRSAFGPINPLFWKSFSYSGFSVVFTTLSLMACVGCLSVIVGVTLAWLLSFYRYPGSRFFQVGLLLPLALPTYVLSFVLIGIFDYAGPFQSLIRAQGLYLPRLNSFWGLVVVLSLAFYPYVFLLVRHAFLSQGRRCLDVDKVFGHSPLYIFTKVLIPFAWPWILGGFGLVILEVMSDFGAVAMFNVNTFTTVLYKAWFGFFSLADAARIASFLVVIALLIRFFGHKGQQQKKFWISGRSVSTKSSQKILLYGPVGWVAFSVSFFLFSLGFLLPFLQLCYWVIRSFSLSSYTFYMAPMFNSLFLAILGSVCVLICAFLLAFFQRLKKSVLSFWIESISTLGYALPGVVLAVGLWGLLQFIDTFLFPGNGFLSGTIVIVLLAYIVRFLAPGFQSIQSAFERIPKQVDEVAATLSSKRSDLVFKVHLPLLKGGVLTGLLLVFVEIMKEMPMTLMTRPFGWDTLAVKIFEYTQEGQFQEAAFPAVVLLIVGLIPLTLVSQKLFQEGGDS